MMSRIMNKLKSRLGESLVETLAAILVFTLSSIVMYTMISTAVNINQKVKDMDSAHQEQMVKIESATGTVTQSTMTFTLVKADNDREILATVPVDVYGTADTLFAFYTHVDPAGG